MKQLKKCIVIPDSYKGTLSSLEVCQIMQKEINNVFPDCAVAAIPVADGGEGTVDCFLAALPDAQRITMTACGPFGNPVSCCYARRKNTAIIEMAQTAGLSLAEHRLNPRCASTYGVGQMISHAVKHGCTDIVIGLGGSCTNDAGVGCAIALGVIFYDENGALFAPSADTLHRISSFDTSNAARFLQDCTITAMCDIDSPMCGKNGAACVFAPQKGADPACVKELDENLTALASVFRTQLQADIAAVPGAGAAGAMGAGIMAFLGGSLKSGIDTVLDLVGFEQELNDAELVFTGEGKIDAQSLGGKAVIGIAKRSAQKNIPVVAVVGAIGDGAQGAYRMGVSAIFSINTAAEAYEVSRCKSRENLSVTMNNILRLLLLP